MKSYLIIKHCQARYIFIIFNNLSLRIQNSSKYLSEQSILSTTGNTTTTKSSYCRFAKQSYMKLKAIVKEENSSEKVNSCREASFVRQPYLNVKGIAHVRDKRQFWSNATVSDAIFVDLPRLRKMQRRDSAAKRQATVSLQSRGVSIFCCLSLLRDQSKSNTSKQYGRPFEWRGDGEAHRPLPRRGEPV